MIYNIIYIVNGSILLVFHGEVSSDLVETLESEIKTTLTDEDRQLMKENEQWMKDYQVLELNGPLNETDMIENDTISDFARQGIYLSFICEIWWSKCTAVSYSFSYVHLRFQEGPGINVPWGTFIK